MKTARMHIRNRRYLRENVELGTFFLPAAILIIVFCYIPLWGVVIAFQDYVAGNSLFALDDTVKWVGFKHFIRFVNNRYFTRLLVNTFRLSLLNLVFGFTTPIIFALLINEIRHLRYKKTIQTISYLPYFISTVVAAGMMISFLEVNGLSYILRQKDTHTDGKLYFIGNISVLPSVIDPVFGYNGVTGGTYGMKIRKDWLDKLGLPMPTTLDEYFDVLVAFRENDANGNGIADERMVIQLNTCNSTFGGFFDTGVSGWFGLANYMFQLNREAWEVELPFFQDGFVEYVNFLKKCVDAGVLYLSDNVAKSDTALSALIAQNVVSSYQYMFITDVYTDASQRAGKRQLPGGMPAELWMTLGSVTKIWLPYILWMTPSTSYS